MNIMNLMAESPIFAGLSPDECRKVASWTVAQWVAWSDLVERSGEDVHTMMERTAGGVMPGIGGAIAGDVGTIGVNGFHGMFVGIEPDGYTHS